jgi:peptidyl-prolyl cis-trans isomerase D
LFKSASFRRRLKTCCAAPDLEKALAEASEKWKVGCSVVSEIRLNSADPTSPEAAEVKKAAEELQKKAQLGSSFEELARQASEGESASLGGRLGCLDAGYGAGAAALIDAAAELGRKGAVSPVVESIRGFHVLKLEGTVTEENKAELVRDFVAYKLTADSLAEKAAQSFAEELIRRANAGTVLADATETLVSETLAGTPFADPLGPALKDEDRPKSDITRAVTIEQNPIAGSAPEEIPAVALFELEKENDTVKKPIKTRDGFAVMQLKSKELLTREKFEEERASVMATLQKRKAEQALAIYVDGLLKAAGAVTMNPKYIPPAGEEEAAKEKDS